jgi:signal peptidase II
MKKGTQNGCNNFMVCLFFGTAGGLAAADLITKWIMSGVGFVQVIPGVFSFSYMLNKGVAFGFGSGSSVLRWVVIVFAVIVSVGGIFMFIKYRNKTRLLSVAGGLFIGGTVGNLVDRVFNGGAVQDFLFVEFLNNTSNLADWGITAGCILLGVWFVFFYGKSSTGQK